MKHEILRMIIINNVSRIFGQGEHEKNFYKGTSLSAFGEFTDFYIWNGHLKRSKMEAWLNFDENIVGDIINWNNATVIAVNLVQEEVSNEHLMGVFSKRKDHKIIVMQKHKSFANAIEMCKSIGGELAVPNDNVKISEFTAVMT